MAEVLETLREDHVNLSALLRLFEKQLEPFEAGEHPDYELLSDVADYCLNYPDLRHHPMEDAVLEKLRDVDPDAAARVGDLEAHHQALRELTRRLLAAIHQILNDAEDSDFFPAAEAALSEVDWAEVANNVAELEDPLFGDKVAEEYQMLHRAILSWGDPTKT